MKSEKNIIGKCPQCGSNVVKTHKGYACEKSLGEQSECSFFLFSTIANRRFSDAEASKFLAERKILLDGFASKEGKNFSSILFFNPDGTVNMSHRIGVCPKCQGQLYVGIRSVSCSNYRHPETPCNFTIWRNIGGHEFTLSELEALITTGKAHEPVDIYDAQGNRSQHMVSLNDAKEVILL